MPCRTCQHFVTSEKAAQRAVLGGFGYCNAAPSPELRARFFRDDSECWLTPTRYQERRP
jgi:hypothetical protein